MGRSAACLSALTALLASGQGTADVIYSNLQNITIPPTYGGVYIDVDGMTSSPGSFPGWDLNPFQGGAYLYNSAAFQPARSGTGGMDTVLNFTSGSTIGSGLNFATFSGGSMSHLGTQFAAGQEGYLGFRLNGTNYGSMRVVFTNNTSGAYIRDWAYDTSGAPVVAGAIKQVGQDIILSSGFTLASALIDSGGATNLVKNGSGTNILKSTNTYTGATTVSAGTLIIAAGGSTHASSAVTVSNSGSALIVNGTINGTLTANASTTVSGSGTIKGAATIAGTLAPGASPGTLTFENTLGLDGATLMEIDGTAGAGLPGGHDFVNLTGAGAAGVLTYGGTLTFDLGTIFAVGSYSWDLFNFASESGTFATISLADQYSGSLLDPDSNGVWDLTSGANTWTFTESTGVLGLTVVPEPRAALLGGLGLLALLCRRR